MTFTLEDVFSSIFRVADTLPMDSLSKSFRFGEHKSQFRGDGYDFDRITEYDPQVHSISQIDWRFMARDKVFVREFRVTKDFPVVVMADLSTSISAGPADRQHKERMILETFGDMGLACFHAQDPVGLIGFAEDVVFHQPPKVSEDNIFYMIEELYKFFDGLSSDGKEKLDRRQTDFYNAFDFLMKMYANIKCLVIVVSDFIGLENLPDTRMLEDVSAQHETVFVFLDDPREFDAGRGLGYVRMKDIESAEQAVVAKRKMQELKTAIRRKRKESREKLREIGVDSVVLEYGKHFQRLCKFFINRQEIFRS